jgi:hypothetical protein
MSLSLNPFAWVLLCSFFSPALGAADLSEGGEWLFELYMEGTRVGSSRVVSKMIDDDTLETTNKIRFLITRGSQNIEVTLNARTLYQWPDGRPLNYEATFVAGRVPTLIKGTFDDNESSIRIKMGPQEFTKHIPLEGDEYLLDDNFLLDHYLVMLASIPIDQITEVHFVVPQLARQFPRVFGMRLKPRGLKKFFVNEQEWEGFKLEAFGDTGLKMDFWIDPEDRTLLRWTVPSQFTEVILSRESEEPTE